MLISEARSFVRRKLRSGNDSSRYTDTDIDEAISIVCNQYVLQTGCTKRTHTITLTADDDTPDFSAPAALGFRPEMIIDFAVVESNDYSASDVAEGISVVGLDEIRQDRACGTSSDTPSKVAFSASALDWSSAKLYPPPKATGTATLIWSPPFTTWSRGGAILRPVVDAGAVTKILIMSNALYDSAGSVVIGGDGSGATATLTLSDNYISAITVTAGGSGYTQAGTTVTISGGITDATLNIPSDLLEPLLCFGASLVPQLADQEAMERILRSQLWKDHVALSRGRGGLGVRSIRRSPLTELGR